MPTTRLQHPGRIILNGESYTIARKKGARLWRETTVPVQPGGGEKSVTFDTWHLGMGHSRLEQPGTYEYGYCLNATYPWKLTIGPSLHSVSAVSGHTFHRLIEYNDKIYAIGVTTSDNDLYYVRLDSTGAIDAEGEIGAGQADGPPGQPAVWEDALYVGVTAGTAYKVHSKSDSGTANAAVTCGASTLTDSREAWTVNEWSGCVITCDSKTMTVASNTNNTLTGMAAWDASQPGDGNSWTMAGDGWTRGNACDALHFCRVGRDLWGVPLDDKAKISKLAAGATWATAWGTDDTGPGDSPWGALYGVGDTGRDINSLIEWGRWLYIGKPDGLFSGDTDGNLWNQIPEVIESASNCLRLEKWQGMLWAPTILGLYRYTGFNARTQGPEVVITNASAIRGGYFTAIAKAGHWAYGGFKAQNGTTYILTSRLREAQEPGVGEVIWHGGIGIGFTSAFTITDMVTSTVTSPPRLWVVLNGVFIYSYTLNKDGSINPTDSNYASVADTQTNAYLSCIDLDSPGTPKAGHFVEVHTAGTLEATKKWVKVYANWDGGGWNQVSSTIETVSTTFTRLFWTAGSNDTGRSLQLRIMMQSDSTSARPEVERVTVNLIESPRREPAIRCGVKLADNLDKKRSLKQMMTDIEALFSGTVYSLTDPDDPAAGTLKVIAHDYEYVEVEQLGTQQAEKQCNLTLRVVSYS